MIGFAKARSSSAGRFCARFAIAFCLLMVGFGESVERGLSSHLGFESAVAFAISGDVPADHDDGGDLGKKSAEVVDHGCHGCAAIPQPIPHGVSTPVAFDERIAWASVPSTDGAEPMIDLPPPRA